MIINLNKKSIVKNLILFLQIMLSIVFLLFVKKFGILPLKYLILIILVLLWLAFIIYYFQNSGRNRFSRKKRRVTSNIVSLTISVCLVFGIFNIAKVNNFLDSFTSSSTQTSTFSLIVLNDSSYEKVKDLNDKVVYVDTSRYIENLEESKTNLKKQAKNIKLMEIADPEKMLSALYDGTVSGILINEAYRTIYENYKATFSSDTRVIWNDHFEEQMDDISKDSNVVKETFTVYISGIDTEGKVSTKSRSDVNLLATIDPVKKEILLTSIPRDYFVDIYGQNGKDKLTHSGLFGVDCTVKSIENLMNIDINYFIRLNFTSLIKIVNALGGIEVESKYEFTTLHGNMKVVAGINKFNGIQALNFVRERYSLPNGDNDRVENQQRVLKAIFNKATSPTVITKYDSLLKAIEGSFETNMSTKEITDLIKMQLNDMASWTFKQQQLKGQNVQMTGGLMMPSSNLFYMLPIDSSVAECSQAIIDMVNRNSEQ